jgi:F0F1-type ATP synthase assembly protein I
MGLVGPESRKQLKQFARFASAGIELVVSIVVGYFGGRYADSGLGTAPYLANSGLVLGIVAGFRNLFKLARDSQPRAEAHDAESPEKQEPPPP